MLWSDDVRVMVHPFRAYAELADRRTVSGGRALLARIAFVLFVIASFVSLTAAGRLVAFHVASTMLFWSFVPAVQAAVFALVVRTASPAGPPRRPLASSLTLYFTGHGPWLLFLLVIAGICLFAPDVYDTMSWLLGHGVLPLLFVGAIGWSGVITFACFRAGLGFSRGRASAATALFYLGFTLVIVGYYLSMNQIQPQVPWAP